jgi:hypothetical protein
MLFIEAPAFTRLLPSYLSDDQYRGLQEALLSKPDAGAVMPQTGGFRKMRWPDPRRGKGGGVDCASFTTTSSKTRRFGL